MNLKTLHPILMSLCLLLPACRVRQTAEASETLDSLHYKRGRQVELFQIIERYDTLGRVRERIATTAREQDSTQLKQSKHHEQTKRTETKPTATALASSSALWSSWRALLLLLLLGIIIGAYATRRWTKTPS